MKVVLQNLTKIFPSRSKKSNEEVIAVNDLNIVIPDGKLVGLLGPSGCGKSTTLYMISGLHKVSKGKIFFGEDDVTELTPENRGVGLVFQNYALYPHMTVKQNILFPLQNLKGEDKLGKEEMIERAYEAAKLVQIDELMDRKPHELSGGQQQRVAIARALVKMPRVLLLDEPLSNLDARLRLQTREEIKRIQKETKITTVFVTHDQEEAMSISDFIVVMKLGVVQQIGKPQDVYDSPVNLFVAKFLGTPPINVFEGEVKDGGLYIGENRVAETGDVPAQEVMVGIRPEGFIVNPDGAFKCKLSNIEVMGRDVSVVSTNEKSVNPIIRSIVDADSVKGLSGLEVNFDIKPNKVFIFNKETEERIYFGEQEPKEYDYEAEEAKTLEEVKEESAEEVDLVEEAVAETEPVEEVKEEVIEEVEAEEEALEESTEEESTEEETVEEEPIEEAPVEEESEEASVEEEPEEVTEETPVEEESEETESVEEVAEEVTEEVKEEN